MPTLRIRSSFNYNLFLLQIILNLPVKIDYIKDKYKKMSFLITYNCYIKQN